MEFTIEAMQFHPAANLFPLLDGPELTELADDIREHGLKVPIVIHKGLILDGRNRFRACQEAGVTPRFVQWEEDGSPTTWVLSLNLKRRHLTPAQKACLAVKLIPIYEEEGREAQRLAGGDKKSETARSLGTEIVPTDPEPILAKRDNTQRSTVKAAKEAGAGRTSTAVMKSVQEKAPEVFDLADTNQLKVSDASALAKVADAAKRQEATRMVVSKEASNAKQAISRLREAERSAAPKDLPQGVKLLQGDCVMLTRTLEDDSISCVVTDPPYGLEVHNTRRGSKDYNDGAGAFDLLDNLCAALVPKLTADAHLYVFAGYDGAWKTKEVLAKHFDVQANPLIWVKDHYTMADLNQNYASKHEYVWFCRVKGSARPLTKAMGDVFEVRRSRESTHSAEKPVELLTVLIEQSTAKGETVFDPFMGSGSTGVAAVACGRSFVGCELEEKWPAVAKSRI